MNRITNHLKRWNKWRKHSLNSPIYKFLVLIGVVRSPTLSLTLTDEEIRKYQEMIYGKESNDE